ncbi:uncharacterized protein N7515_004753 [Penicillium bovifimosum]|uniref:Methyltransferase type 11 domain-containing protein n=1 Tax=Penicillium bovifimosum TaxID=126998 RepID=A0A9W9H0W1_9EURO|nr:uncharacterized protein N7515_004753 [Penicillium bovifimosum]KAJ5135475.1 hypothetical protein N7515_004753 [Penicillium bovifimosum]
MTQTIQELLAKSSATSQPTRYVDTVEAYDNWAEVYDTDGNFLQRLDTIEMQTLLPNIINLIDNQFKPTPNSPPHPIILDLGCGTGRNTMSLLSALYTANRADRFSVVGLDASRGMLEVARTAVGEYVKKTAAMSDTPASAVELGILDLLQPDLRLPGSLCAERAAGVISTLVLEHIPLERFFAAAAGLIRTGGYLLVTNMHAEMGRRSQAGVYGCLWGEDSAYELLS